MVEKELYKTSGQLSAGYQGHISYLFFIPENMKSLDITFEFDKREPTGNLEEIEKKGIQALLQNIPDLEVTQSVKEQLLKMPKSEINVSVFHNGACLGTAHRNLLLKEIHISPEYSSEGFLQWKTDEGNLRIVLHVLNVLNDNTNFSLVVKGEVDDL
ncbi:DUF6669 family protein [Clostridium sp. HBUAS56010]|uniref:DUF6669 family protein n=1 Tax=Clostridium sp. HBUAS56010 TaxID=2571127 RepID=UPI0011777D81|nr:DUF6669 family protein [Clostridium sp. HBUAS56010]